MSAFSTTTTAITPLSIQCPIAAVTPAATISTISSRLLNCRSRRASSPGGSGSARRLGPCTFRRRLASACVEALRPRVQRLQGVRRVGRMPVLRGVGHRISFGGQRYCRAIDAPRVACPRGPGRGCPEERDRVCSDIEIAQQATLQRITDVASKLGIADEHLEPYGHYKAKISLDYLDSLPPRPDGKLILVTAISPTPAGEGKTTTTVGLGDALNRIGKRPSICLREPSLGPVFGVKGGAAGGGYAQVVPMEDINLHFTGDFNAIALANNLLAAMIDNHIHHGNELGIDVRRITWKRVMDMNDRALRDITVSLGGPANGYPREDGFDIVVASEVMAIFCLATSIEGPEGAPRQHRGRLHPRAEARRARDLKAHGAMTVLLKDALNPTSCRRWRTTRRSSTAARSPTSPTAATR
jgi:hypothetical protein